MRVGGAVIALLVLLGRNALGQMLDAGHGWFLLAFALAVGVTAAALVVRHIVSPHVGREIGSLADIAEAIAAGDLSRRPENVGQGGELGRLARAMGIMSQELGELAGLMGTNAAETVRRSSEITGGTEDMAKATNENFFRLFSKVPRPARFSAAA